MDNSLTRDSELSQNELQMLTPAESLMLLHPGHADGKKMMILTFVDLLLKKVIETNS